MHEAAKILPILSAGTNRSGVFLIIAPTPSLVSATSHTGTHQNRRFEKKNKIQNRWVFPPSITRCYKLSLTEKHNTLISKLRTYLFQFS